MADRMVADPPPAVAIARAADGKSRTKLPVRKNVAGTCSRCNVARIEATPSALAPASKVSATTCREVGIEVQSFPASQPVTGRVPGDAGLVADGRGDGVAGGAVLAAYRAAR